MDWKMKTGLLIVSVTGFIAAAYFLMQDLVPVFEDINELIYIILLVLWLNCKNNISHKERFYNILHFVL
jgi:hypothetical protein